MNNTMRKKRFIIGGVVIVVATTLLLATNNNEYSPAPIPPTAIPNPKPPPISSPVTNTIAPVEQEIPDGFIKPASIIIPERCINLEYAKARSDTVKTCDPLGAVDVSPSIHVIAKVVEHTRAHADAEHTQVYADGKIKLDVYLEFFKNNLQADIPPYYFPQVPSGAPVRLPRIISYLDDNNIYLSDDGGFEGVLLHYYFDGADWSKFTPWDLIKNDFPDTIQPPFSFIVSPEFIRITEENYCCDTLFSYTPGRWANRMVFILDRISKNIIEMETIPRRP